MISQWQAALRAGVQRMQDSGEVDRQLDAAYGGRTRRRGTGRVIILMSTGSIAHREAALDTSLTLLRTVALPAPHTRT
ncbi:hypothetical protein [Streptomyces sp. 5-6(2022)]|uniref:hypothetical protein n=1 Tax=Streptomyces sp. 5-6(2022) TaxID=2936510 RepID=UPI0031BB796A